MLITLNGATREVAEATPVAELMPPDRRGVAVAVNGEVVPGEHVPEHRLAAGDRVEIVTAVQGG